MIGVDAAGGRDLVRVGLLGEVADRVGDLLADRAAVIHLREAVADVKE